MDSEKALFHRRVEHARDQETEETPRVADALDAGRSEFRKELGLKGVQVLIDQSSNLALKLTERPGHLERFGKLLHEMADPGDLPTRLEIKQDLRQEGEIDPDEVAPENVGETYRERIIGNLGNDEVCIVAHILVNLSDGGQSISHEESTTMVERYEESCDVDIGRGSRQRLVSGIETIPLQNTA